MKKKAATAGKATPGVVNLGGRTLRIEYNFLAYSVIREVVNVSPLDGFDFKSFTEAQYVGFLVAGLLTHQANIEVGWIARNLNLKNFDSIMEMAYDAYVASLPKRVPKANGENPQKPVS